MRVSDILLETINWQGNQGSEQSKNTEHTIEEARRYVKENYPKNKTYSLRRLEPGFRALDIKTGNMKPEQVNAALNQEAAINQFVKVFNLKQNQYMSGSEQVSSGIGFSWHVGEDRERRHAIFYYEDRGMGNDTITIAAKTLVDLKLMEEFLIQTGLVTDPAERKAKVAATVNNRNDALEKKNIRIGSRITSYRIDNNEVSWSGIVTNIGNTGIVEITIDQVHAQQQAYKIGDKHKMKPGSISKSMVSNNR